MSVLGVVGAAAGFFLGGPQGAMLGYSIGSGVDALLNPPKQQGPRLEDLEVQMAAYGSPIPHEWGVNRHVGTVMWPKNLVLKESSETESAKGGPEMTTYSYSCSIAVLMCEGPIAGVRRIWANKKIIYDVTADNEGATRDPALSGLRIYLGTETQQVDPLIEATDGPSPAYLGYAYCVFEDFDLTEYANRPPQFEFEIITEGGGEVAPIKPLLPTTGWTAGAGFATIDTDTGYIWANAGGPTGEGNFITVVDPVAEEVVASIQLSEPGTPTTMVFIDARNEIWVGNIEFGSGWILSAIDMTEIGRFSPSIELRSTTLEGTAQGSLVYVAETAEVWAFFQDTYLYDNYVSIINTITRQVTGSFRYTDGEYDFGATNAPLYVPDRGWVVVPRASGIFILDVSARKLIQRLESPFDGSTIYLRTYYDATNQRLYVWGYGTNIFYYDAAGLTLVPTEVERQAVSGVYNPQDGNLYLSVPELGSPTLEAVNPDDFSTVNTLPNVDSAYLGKLFLSPNADKLIGTDGMRVDIIPITPRLAPAQVPLSLIVGDLCTMKEGLAPTQVDTAALTPMVDGYPITRQMPRRAAIEALQPIYGFDAVENDSKIQFVMRGGAVAAVITEEDRAARDFGADLPDSLSITRAQDMELPVEVELEYPDVDADHLVGAQYSRRLTKDTRQKVNMQTAVVMGATKAKAVTEVNLYEAWLQTTFKWTTTRKFSHLLPTDVVELQTKAATYRARITMKREQPNGVIEWEGKQEAVEVYTQTGAGAAPTNYVRQTIYSPELTDLELLDIPMLRDSDNDAGFYVAMG